MVLSRQECVTVSRQQCKTINRQQCKTVEKPFTTQVPEQKCLERLDEVCVPVPRQKCHTVQDKVPKLVSTFLYFSVMAWRYILCTEGVSYALKISLISIRRERGGDITK